MQPGDDLWEHVSDGSHPGNPSLLPTIPPSSTSPATSHSTSPATPNSPWPATPHYFTSPTTCHSIPPEGQRRHLSHHRCQGARQWGRQECAQPDVQLRNVQLQRPVCFPGESGQSPGMFFRLGCLLNPGSPESSLWLFQTLSGLPPGLPLWTA